MTNRIPTAHNSGLSSFEKLYGTWPDYSSLRVFGCTCFVLKPHVERTKLSLKSTLCVFLEYISYYFDLASSHNLTQSELIKIDPFDAVTHEPPPVKRVPVPETTSETTTPHTTTSIEIVVDPPPSGQPKHNFKSTKRDDFVYSCYSNSFSSFIFSVHCLHEPESYRVAVCDPIWHGSLGCCFAYSRVSLVYSLPDTFFPFTSALDLRAYYDSDWAGDVVLRKSTTELCIFLGESLILWKSKKCDVLFKYYTGAEYRTMAATTSEIVWLRWLLADIDVPIICQNTYRVDGDGFTRFEIMPPRMTTRSASRATAVPRGGRMGGRTGRGDGRTGGRFGDQGNGRIDGQGGQVGGQGSERLREWLESKWRCINDNIRGDVRNVIENNDHRGCTYKEFLACNPKEDNQKVKYTSGSFVGKALTWWNSQIYTRGQEATVGPAMLHTLIDSMSWLGMVAATEPTTVQKVAQIAGTLTDEAIRNGPIKKNPEKRGNKGESNKDRNKRDYNKRTRTGNAFSTTANPVRREYMGTAPKCTNCNFHHPPKIPCRTCFNCNFPRYFAKDRRVGPRNVNPINARNPTTRACYECGSTKHIKAACPRRGSPGPEHRDGGSFDMIIGMDWFSNHKAEIIFHEKVVRIPVPDDKVLRVIGGRPKEKIRHLRSAKTKEKKTRYGHFKFTEMPFGLTNAPAGEEQERAFQTLKDKLCNARVLALPDRPEDFMVYYDAFSLGLGCMLMQRELFSDYDCEIRYHPGKANVVADALSRKERVKSKRVQAMNMTFQSSIKDRTLVVQEEAFDESAGLQKLLDKMIEHRRADKMYYDLRDRIAMYFVTKLPRTSSRHDTIQVIMDRLTKSAHFLPMRKDYKMDRLARLCLNEIVATHEVGEGHLIGPELAQETIEKISQIKDILKVVRDRQKSYADKRMKPLEFSVGDYVLLKLSAWKGVVCFGKKGKLAPRFVGTFEIIKKEGLVAYRLRLPEKLNGVHDTFHVLNLKKCLADPTLQVPLDEIRVDAKLNFVEEPVEILEREFKMLKRSRIAIVKVRWKSKHGPEFT
nr:putative reverse transcriptase domain-containing protein [Tanacetum cinerariifolium]